MAQTSATRFDPLGLPGCAHCGARVRLRTPGGTEYAGPPLGCCLTRSLHQVGALLLRLQDPDLRGLDRAPYQRDLQDNVAAIERHLSGVANRATAIQEARAKLPQLAAHQWASVQAVVGGAR